MDELSLKTFESNTTEYVDSYVLRQLLDIGKISTDDVEDIMRQSHLEKEIKKLHKGKIYQDDRGRWCTYVRAKEKGGKRRQIARTHREDLLMALYSYYTEENYIHQVKTSVESLYPKWLEYKRGHTYSEGTIERYKTDWNRFYKGTWLAKAKVEDLTRLQLDEWAYGMVKKYEMTSTQYSNMSTILRQILNYAVELGIIEKSVFNEVKVEKRMLRRRRKKADETQVYSYEEQKQIFELAWKEFELGKLKQPLTPLAVMFQFLTGLRVSELCAIRYEDIVKDKTILIRRMVIRDTHNVVDHTKGSFGDREVMLPTEALHLINVAREYQIEHGYPSDGYIFSITDEFLTYRSVTDTYRRYCKKLGISLKGSHGSRKAYISSLIDADVNINTIREMVGHTDERTTLNNYCYDRSSMEERWNKINSAVSATITDTEASANA